MHASNFLDLLNFIPLNHFNKSCGDAQYEFATQLVVPYHKVLMSHNDFGNVPDPEKQKIRERVWNMMEQSGVARFPGAWGRIPNFEGAEKAAELAAETEEFRRASVIKVNPDSPQRKLRYIALKEGKLLYMAVPRLRSLKCFVKLDPMKLPKGSLWRASSIKGAFEYGIPVAPWEMEKVDLVIAGSVAVNRKGQRIGKGGGYSDLEFAIARFYHLIDDDTPIMTTVHGYQILDHEFPWKPHDIPVDIIVTPVEVIRTNTRFPKPDRIYREDLTAKQIEKIPILRHIFDLS